MRTRIRLFAVIFGLALPLAHAGTFTWTGAAGSLWSGATNWSPNGVPANGDTLVFPYIPTRPFPAPPVVNDLNGLSLAEVRIEHDYELIGNTLEITTAITVPGGSARFNLPLSLPSAAVTMSVTQLTGSLRIEGPLSGTAAVSIPNKSLFLAGDHPFAGTLSGGVVLDGARLPNATYAGGFLTGNGAMGPTHVTSNLLPGFAGIGVLETANLALQGTLGVEIGGTIPGSGYDQVRAEGAVALAGPLSVTLTGGFVPTPGQVFTVIDNDGADAVIGTFTGSPEASTFSVNGHQFRIGYAGGDGNDVTLTALTGSTLPAPQVSFPAVNIGPTMTGAYAFLGSCNLDGRAVTVTIGSLQAIAPCGSPYAGAFFVSFPDVTSVPDGDVVITASHGYDGGPVAQHSITVRKDLTPPNVTIATLAPIDGSNNAAYVVSGTCEVLPDRQVHVRLTSLGVFVEGNTTCPAGAYTVTLDARSLPNGTVTVRANQFDLFGNSGVVETTTSKSGPLPPQVITSSTPSEQVYGASIQLHAAGGPSGQPLAFENETPSVCTLSMVVSLGPTFTVTVSMVGVGACRIGITQAGNATYAPAERVVVTFNVAPAPVSIAMLPIADRVLGDPAFTVTAVVSAPVTPMFSSSSPGVCIVNGDTAHLLAAGTCTIVARIESAVYQPASASQSFQVALPPPGIAVFPLSVDFGGQSMNTTSVEHTITVTGTTAGSLSVGTLTTTGPFSARHACVAPVSTCLIRISFTPTAEGPINGTLRIDHNAPGGSVFVALGGTGERSLVSHFYAAILGRLADSAGHAYWTGEATRLASLGANMNEAWFAMALAFFDSAEYRALAVDDGEFLTDLYLTFFNRAPDSAGLAYWSSLLQQGLTRENVLQSFLFSSEFDAFTRAIFGDQAARAEAEMLMDFYRGVFARLPDSAGFNYWLGRLRTAQCTSIPAVTVEASVVTELFFLSPEYASRARTKAEYVSDLYNTFMRRGGDLAGQQFWVSQLAGGVSRETVRNAFIASPEFQARVQAVVGAGCLQ